MTRALRDVDTLFRLAAVVAIVVVNCLWELLLLLRRPSIDSVHDEWLLSDPSSETGGVSGCKSVGSCRCCRPSDETALRWAAASAMIIIASLLTDRLKLALLLMLLSLMGVRGGGWIGMSCGME